MNDITDILGVSDYNEAPKIETPKVEKKEEKKEDYQWLYDSIDTMSKYGADVAEETAKWVTKWVAKLWTFAVDTIVNAADIAWEVPAWVTDVVTNVWAALINRVWESMGHESIDVKGTRLLQQEGFLDELNKTMDIWTTEIDKKIDEVVWGFNTQHALDDTVLKEVINFTWELAPMFIGWRWVLVPVRMLLWSKKVKWVKDMIKIIAENKQKLKLEGKTMKDIAAQMDDIVKAWSKTKATTTAKESAELAKQIQTKKDLINKLAKDWTIKFKDWTKAWLDKFSLDNVILPKNPVENKYIRGLLITYEKLMWSGVDKVKKVVTSKPWLVTWGILAAGMWVKPDWTSGWEETTEENVDESTMNKNISEASGWTTEVEDTTEDIVTDESSDYFSPADDIELDWKLDWSPVFYRKSENTIWINKGWNKITLEEWVQSLDLANDLEQNMRDYMDKL